MCSYFRQQIALGQVKVILLIRDPKDTMTSYYHFYRLVMSYSGTWDQFFEMIKENQLIYGDYFDWYADWAKIRELENVLCIRYEDIKNDHIGTVNKIARFIGKQLSDEKLLTIIEATTFTRMKNNPSTNQINNPAFDQSKGQFMRKGQIGDWKNYFNQGADLLF